MKKVFIIMLFLPLVCISQVVFAATFSYGTTSKVSAASNLSQQNNAYVNKQLQKYGFTPSENVSQTNKQPDIFTREEANKSFQSPAMQESLSNYQKKKQTDEVKKKNPSWWRQESSIDGWGTGFFGY